MNKLNDYQDEYFKELESRVAAECLSDNSVAQNINLRYFTSKSKGVRNGKLRIRRHWKEIRLVKYHNGFHLWHRCPFDEWATEIIGQWADGEILKERIMDLTR